MYICFDVAMPVVEVHIVHQGPTAVGFLWLGPDTWLYTRVVIAMVFVSSIAGSCSMYSICYMIGLFED